MKTIDSYERKALDFAAKHKVKFAVFNNPEYRQYWPGDRDPRYVFKCRLPRGLKSYTFTYGQSIVNNDQKPNIYNVLSRLTKYDPGTFEDFCNDCGYSEDSRSAEKIYHSVVKEWKAVKRLFVDILEELREIK